ncbi:MAG: ABC transporter ATP-binding protein [Acidimicrobiia bacterium]
MSSGRDAEDGAPTNGGSDRLGAVIRRLEEARARPRMAPDATFGHPADSGLHPGSADGAGFSGTGRSRALAAPPGPSEPAPPGTAGAGVWQPASPRLLERTRPFRLAPPSREEFEAHLTQFLKSRLRRSGPLFRTVHLRVEFSGCPVLDCVDLEVNDGEVVAVLGPEGSGKTVLLDALCGLTPVESGRVYLGRADLSGAPSHSRAAQGLARTFQDGRLFSSLTVAENLMVAQNSRMSGGFFAGGLRSALSTRQDRRARARALEVLELLGVADCADWPVGRLDARGARLVELGRALAPEPEIALLDDPAQGLRAEDASELAERLAEVCDEMGVTILIAARELEEMSTFADHVYLLEGGRVVASGAPDEVILTADDPGGSGGVSPSSEGGAPPPPGTAEGRG